jgi:kynurenine formamidase
MTLSSLADRLASATVIDLEQPRRFGDPTFEAHQPGMMLTLHRRHEPGLGESRTSASALIVTAEHSGTHIDALCHQADSMTMYGGIEVTSEVQTSRGFTQLGIDTTAPMLRPAVLLDLAALRPAVAGGLISADDLKQAHAASGQPIEAGDVVLVRTGLGAIWSRPSEYLAGPGMGTDASCWLASLGVSAVGADNVAWDLPGYVDPDIRCTLPGHVVLIVQNGIHILENLNLEGLAAAKPGRFTFVCLPLKIVGGTGCPVRPIAIIEPSTDPTRFHSYNYIR